MLRLVSTIRFSDPIFTQIQWGCWSESTFLLAETMLEEEMDPKIGLCESETFKTETFKTETFKELMA